MVSSTGNSTESPLTQWPFVRKKTWPFSCFHWRCLWRFRPGISGHPHWQWLYWKNTGYWNGKLCKIFQSEVCVLSDLKAPVFSFLFLMPFFSYSGVLVKEPLWTCILPFDFGSLSLLCTAIPAHLHVWLLCLFLPDGRLWLRWHCSTDFTIPNWISSCQSKYRYIFNKWFVCVACSLPTCYLMAIFCVFMLPTSLLPCCGKTTTFSFFLTSCLPWLRAVHALLIALWLTFSEL